MSWLEEGSGDPVVLLHGNPTSSYLWREVIGHLAPLGRCLAVDLVGMGASDKRAGTDPDRYSFHEHARYLAELLDVLGVADDPGRTTLVGHDWGAVLAVHWARTRTTAPRGIAYLETLVAPVAGDSPNAPDPELFGPLRSAAGERRVLEENVFVETVLPAGTARQLTAAEMAAYREPYAEPGESRRPTLSWARQIPVDGEPADVHEVVAANAAWMAGSPVPKLLVSGEPGALLTGPLRERCRTWPAQEEVAVPGLHFLPEDSPHEIGEALAWWVGHLPGPGPAATGPGAT